MNWLKLVRTLIRPRFALTRIARALEDMRDLYELDLQSRGIVRYKPNPHDDNTVEVQYGARIPTDELSEYMGHLKHSQSPPDELFIPPNLRSMPADIRDLPASTFDHPESAHSSDPSDSDPTEIDALPELRDIWTK